MAFLWDGLRVEKIISIDKNTIPEIISVIENLRGEHNIPNSKIVIDQDGVGGGVVDAFSGCVGFVNGGKAHKKENYANLKTQCYFKLAELVNEGKVFIKDKTYKDVIITELEVVKRDKVDKDSQKLAIEGKDIQKQKLGRSPDYADAIMMRMWFESFGSYGEYAII